MSEPGYWMREMSGAARKAVAAYFHGCMTPEDIAVMRAYLRQWIMSPVWKVEGEDDPIISLRERIDELTSREAFSSWLAAAASIGIDPL